MQLHIDVFGTHMLVSIRKEIKNSFTGDSNSVSAAVELSVPSFRILAAFLHVKSYMIMISISNYKSFVYIVKSFFAYSNTSFAPHG